MRWLARTAISTTALFGPALLAGAASAAEWYVDNSGAVPCSDSLPGGSETRPWCRINYAIERVQPGDVVFVKTGTYREEVYISRKVGGPNYITIRNYPGHFPIIEGTGVERGRNKIIESSHIRFIGFTITNMQQGLFVEASNNIILQNLKVHNVGQEAVRIRLNSSFVTLSDSTIYDTRKWRFNGEGVYIGTSSSQQPNDPPYDNTHDILVKNNTIYNTGDECVEAKEGTYNVIIDGNKLHNCLLDPSIASLHWGGIELMDQGKYYGSNPNHVIKNNIIHMTKTAIGVHTGATVFNNVIYGQTGDFRGISIDNADADIYVRRVYHNTIDLPNSRAIVVSGRASADIRNNIGPSSTGNIAAQKAYFINTTARDYHLAPGGAPINAGVSLTDTVPQDIEGSSRSENKPPDLGAYEYRGGPEGAPSPARRR
ncbi:MAG TPA: right-handed parallel beta-helix repeat-containing protein [Hyphomicrobiaceae bacterium]|jgi:hypothetical protein|nr:right-handed parallel beta-helix repeat-containing protein [Hyphomicrobiaceae bacterium]